MSANRWLATGNFFTSYREEQRIYRTHLDALAFCLFIAAVFAWPLFFETSNKLMLIVDNILIAIIAIMGLNLLTGYAGLISIGHAAFLGVGAYTIAAMSQVLAGYNETYSIFITHYWPLAILMAGFMGAVVGALVGLPAMRLKHLYLAIATLSFQMIFQWLINFMKFFNQGQTMFVDRVYWFTGKVGRDEHYLFWYYALLVIVVITGFAVRNLLRTKYGRALVAVRDNDRAADAMGMHPGFTKVFAFALGGFLAGVAGALHAYLYRGAGFESFTLHHSIQYLAMAIVGGLGTFTGAIFGPLAIIFLNLGVEQLSHWVGNYVTFSMNLATALKPLAFGLVIVLFLMFEPRGIANWWRIIKTYFKLWPFKY